LAGLYRQWVDAPDVSAVADFFRVSPWSAREMDVALSQFVMHDLIQRAESSGKTYTVYVSIDDSLTGKDKDTKSLETVDWHHDHDASTKKKATYCNGAVHISCRVQIAECSYTFAWRMYLREKTVRRLNRKRSKHQRVKFQTKYHLAREMLAELKPFIPKGWKVYVLFDNWYASAKLIKYIKRQGKNSYEAIHRWYSVVYLTFSFLQWQLYEARASGQPLSSVADVIKLKKAEHAREVLIAACKEAIACGEVEPVVERFINPLQMAA
jgi:hypothetical protein